MTREGWRTCGQVFLLIAVLYLFLVSIGLMGSAFKLFGRDLARQLIEMTSNPLIGLVAGILATSLVQSSSTTTSITVGLVAAGGLSIEGAIPIVMGANIGTSVTCILVSLGHITRREEFRRALAGATVHDFFNLMTVVVLFPLEVMTGYLRYLSSYTVSAFAGVGGLKVVSPLKMAVQPAVNALTGLLWQNGTLVLVVSLVMLYLALKFLVDLTRGLIVHRTERFLHRYLFGAPLLSMAFGLLLTALVQSSSITTSLVIPLVGAGILTVEQIFPYTLGANVGTTVTAMLAALSTANVAAVTIAFAHLFFNVCGIAMVYPIRQIRSIPIWMAHLLADLASRSRGLAVAYILVVFYVIPGLMIFFGR